VVEHCGVNLVHEGLCLEVEVAHHGITMPSTQHMKGGVVNLVAQEGHGTTVA
jgi:hypothetical protein